MDVGLALPQMGSGATADAVRPFAERAEHLGYDSLWVQDHFLSPLDPRLTPGYNKHFETESVYPEVTSPLELLAYTAACTSRVRLGSSVLVAGYYWPAQLAHRLATLDALSGGRIVVGLGIGWSQEEHEQVGVDVRTRARRFDDFIPALKACWGADPISYEGPFFRIPPSVLRPKPVQRPYPRLLLGSTAKGLHRADHFDGWTIGGRQSIEEVAATVKEINAHRPSHLHPMTVHYRIFTEYPGLVDPADNDVQVIADKVAAAKDAGFAEVIIDASWGAEMSDPENWLNLPDRLAPVLAAAS